MFVVELDRANFEYDVHSIVKAFYPEEQVTVLIPEMREEKRAQLQAHIRIRIHIREDGAAIWVDGAEFTWNHQMDSEGGKSPEKAFKDGFKQFFYRKLKQVTGKSLPWGNLTGIRPTKIAFQLLDLGMDTVEILTYYRERYDVTREKAELSLAIARREREMLA